MSNAITPGHRIAVISDTHNLLRPEVADVVRTCEIVLHGGDISGPETLEKVRNLCGNFYVVRGNNDRDWASGIPYTLEVELYGRKFFMTHKKKDIPSDVEADVVIYGHSHRYAQDYINGTLYLNPGSCGPRRFNQAITMAVLTVPDTDLSRSVRQCFARRWFREEVLWHHSGEDRYSSCESSLSSLDLWGSLFWCKRDLWGSLFPQSGHGRSDPQDWN